MNKIIVGVDDKMTILPDPVLEFAKQLFLKSYKPQLFLNEQSVKQYDADIKNSIKVAELFMEMYENKKWL